VAAPIDGVSHVTDAIQDQLIAQHHRFKSIHMHSERKTIKDTKYRRTESKEQRVPVVRNVPAAAVVPNLHNNVPTADGWANEPTIVTVCAEFRRVAGGIIRSKTSDAAETELNTPL